MMFIKITTVTRLIDRFSSVLRNKMEKTRQFIIIQHSVENVNFKFDSVLYIIARSEFKSIFQWFISYE